MSVESVLVIDDDASVRENFKRILRPTGIRLSVAMNAKFGMEELEKSSFTCVFCDLRMPLISGEEVLAHVVAKYPTTPVIVMTEVGKPSSAVEFIKKGAFDYLTKPVNREIVLATIQRASEHKASTAVKLRGEQERRDYSDRIRSQFAEMRERITKQCELVNQLNKASNMEEILLLVEAYTIDVLKTRKAVTMLLADEEFTLEEFRRLTNVPSRCFTIPADHAGSIKQFFVGKLSAIYNPYTPDTELLAEIIGTVEEPDLRRTLFIPLSANEWPLGLVVLLEAKDRDRDYDEEERLQMLFIAETASTAIHNCLKSLKLEKGYLDTVVALTRAVEAKDPYTRGHSDRVRLLAAKMAGALQLSEELIKYIDIAGILHDVGKIGIPLDIINKKTALDPMEYERIKAHPVIGEMMISHIRFLTPVREIIRHHHERFDGRGYPDHLKGEQISTGARILAVADSYDAMTTDRPYRKALTPYQAYLELQKNSGTQFDPRYVAALAGILGEGASYLTAV